MAPRKSSTVDEAGFWEARAKTQCSVKRYAALLVRRALFCMPHPGDASERHVGAPHLCVCVWCAGVIRSSASCRTGLTWRQRLPSSHPSSHKQRPWHQGRQQ